MLSSQMKQEIIGRTKDNIKGLSNSKKNGNKIGKLHFKRRIRTIPLKQYGNTYNISGNYIKIQKIGRLKVSGINQIPKDADIANATLESRNGDYFIYISTFTGIKDIIYSDNGIGIDFGVKSSLTLSNFNYGSCNLYIDRDLNASINILEYMVPAERRKLHDFNVK